METQRRVQAWKRNSCASGFAATDRSAEAQVLAGRRRTRCALILAAKEALLQKPAVSGVHRSCGTVRGTGRPVALARRATSPTSERRRLRVATQQSALTGSANRVAAWCAQARRTPGALAPTAPGGRAPPDRPDLRPRKALGVTDVTALAIKIDEAVRMVDELPLLTPDLRRDAPPRRRAASIGRTVRRPTPATGLDGTLPAWLQPGSTLGRADRGVWLEARSLVRVTHRVTEDDAARAHQAYFLPREPQKLRLLNARLALLARQFDTAQADLRGARGARPLLRPQRQAHAARRRADRQVAAQSRQVSVPRPTATLAALSTAAAGRWARQRRRAHRARSHLVHAAVRGGRRRRDDAWGNGARPGQRLLGRLAHGRHRSTSSCWCWWARLPARSR